MLKKRIIIASILLSFVFMLSLCRTPEAIELTENDEVLSGGSQTIFDEGTGAYSNMFPRLTASQQMVHGVGDAAFEATFVTAPAPKNSGLGPLFNSVSCTSCHISDGRGKPPLAGEAIISLLIRTSIPGSDTHGEPMPAPGFGGQLQQRAIFGSKPEAEVNISYSTQSYSFEDGTPYQLQSPNYKITNSYIPLPSGLMISPRIAPPVFGLGLLEAIPETDILALADEGDANNDGISGRANLVWDEIAQKATLGRFGWKAGQPSVIQQSAAAYNQDMGITNFIFKKESSHGQAQYDNFNDENEISDSILHAVAFYIKTLAVPARRNITDATVLKGKQIFAQAKCGSCHTPKSNTSVNVAFSEISNMTIFPYSDLLLHDMGSGLADNRPEFLANGQEWRTPPLWGIGLTQKVNGHNNFLHDGRARTLLEAIMWHGGEAQNSKIFVEKLSKTDREALLKFLGSL